MPTIRVVKEREARRQPHAVRPEEVTDCHGSEKTVIRGPSDFDDFACLTALRLIVTIHFLCRLQNVPSGEIPGETTVEK